MARPLIQKELHLLIELLFSGLLWTTEPQAREDLIQPGTTQRMHLSADINTFFEGARILKFLAILTILREELPVVLLLKNELLIVKPHAIASIWASFGFAIRID